MAETQRIIWYEPLTYQSLATDGADIQTYHEFRSAFEDIAGRSKRT
jgi:hypothetical protein